jgi:hypothetical protein
MPNQQPAPTNSAAQQALEQLQKYYFYLNDNFASLIGKCTTDDERNQLKIDFVVARDAYLKAQNDVLVEHDGILATLSSQLSGLQKQINDAVASAQNIVKVLQLVAIASGVAAKVVTAGIA